MALDELTLQLPLDELDSPSRSLPPLSSSPVPTLHTSPLSVSTLTEETLTRVCASRAYLRRGVCSHSTKGKR